MIENKLSIYRTNIFKSITILTLRNTGLSGVISDLKINNIVDISKNALVKKRNNDVTHMCMKNMNDNIINMIYDPSNNFIKPYNFRIDDDKRSYINNNLSSIDKKLSIDQITDLSLVINAI